jgi:hypothetical protein
MVKQSGRPGHGDQLRAQIGLPGKQSHQSPAHLIITMRATNSNNPYAA